MLALAAVALAALVAACGSTATGGEATGEAAAGGALCSGSVAVMAPYSGTGPSDNVQMNWARVALDKFNLERGTDFSLVPSNVDADPVKGKLDAVRIVSDPGIFGVVGPKTSIVTAAAGPIFDKAGLVYVSASATNAALTDGGLKYFYRVVASDALQAPAMARFVYERLDPQTVLLVTDDEAYSQGLGDAVAKQLTADGVDVIRVPVKLKQESYSEVVTRVSPNVNVVVAPLLDATDAKRLADELHAAGKSPAIIGGDALFVDAFAVPGAYVTTYAPDISKEASGIETVRLYASIFGAFESFGGPAYVAMDVILNAAYDVCQREGRITRHLVALQVPKTNLESSILGIPIEFDERHELKDATIKVYRVTSNGFELIK